jgi:hypothetical protein
MSLTFATLQRCDYYQSTSMTYAVLQNYRLLTAIHKCFYLPYEGKASYLGSDASLSSGCASTIFHVSACNATFITSDIRYM